MRTDLNMRKGKMVAQGAHASMMFLTTRIGLWGRAPNEMFVDARLGITDPEAQWIRGTFTKICVGVDSLYELLNVRDQAYLNGLTQHLVTDSGLTEFDGVPTMTCVAIGPNYADEIDKITGHLRLL